MILEPAIIILSTAGLYISAYFTLVYYGLLNPSSRLVPEFCRLKDYSCGIVLRSRYAHLLRVPNSIPGLAYYLTAIIAVMTGALDGKPGLLLAGVSWIAAAVSILLAYSLLRIIRIPCPLCFTSHIINLCLALLITAEVFFL